MQVHRCKNARSRQTLMHRYTDTNTHKAQMKIYRRRKHRYRNTPKKYRYTNAEKHKQKAQIRRKIHAHGYRNTATNT